MGKILSLPSDISVVEFYSVLACARGRLRERRMLLLDAFRAFDFDRNGVLSEEELYGGITWLGIELSQLEARELAAVMDSDQDGCITFRDFRRTLRSPMMRIAKRRYLTSAAEEVELEEEEEEEVLQLEEKVEEELATTVEQGEEGGGGEAAIIPLRWQGIKPRAVRPEDGRQLQRKNVAENFYERLLEATAALRVDLHDTRSLARIWNSKNSGSREQATVWCPKMPSPSNHKVHICVGHYVSKGLGRADGDNVERHYITLSDTTSWRLFKSAYIETDVLDVLVPHPLRYQEVWRQRRGDRPLFIWRPIPPTEDFVALGMLATATDDPPPVQECRCVPRVWVVPSSAKPVQVWNDSGAGGRPGSFWVMTKMGLLQATEQHLKPKGVFFDLHKSSFQANYRLKDFNLRWAQEGSSSASSSAVPAPPRRRAPRGDILAPTLVTSDSEDITKRYKAQRSLLQPVKAQSSPAPRRSRAAALYAEIATEPEIRVSDLYPGSDIQATRALEQVFAEQVTAKDRKDPEEAARREGVAVDDGKGKEQARERINLE